MLLLPLLLSAEKRVELVANFDVDTADLTRGLAAGQMSLEVVASDLSAYSSVLGKDRSRFGKLMRKLSLDFPKKWDPGAQVHKIVFWNLSCKHRRGMELSKLPKEKMVLFLWEPPLILRKMYKAENLEIFSKIYTWNDDLVDNVTTFKFYYPVLRQRLDDIPSFEEKKFCTLVSSNGVKSAPGELYSERRRAIEFFEKAGEKGFEFYGRGWEAKNHPSYRGPVHDKLQTIKNYRFYICYENSSELKGYITEKIFDCFAAGTLPIYWGATNIEQVIPKECFIDRRDFQTLDELYAFLKKMDKRTYEMYQKNIQRFLVSETAKLFSHEHFMQTFMEAVQ